MDKCKNINLKRMKKKGILLIFLIITILGCQSKKETNAELFQKYLDKNVAAFVKTMSDKNVDTIQAKEYCTCLFYKLYSIDSTFFKLPNDSLNLLIQKNAQIIEKECGKMPSDNM